MDRAQINSWTPPEIAERAADAGVAEYSAEDLKEAREEIVEAILGTSKGWRGHSLDYAFQHHLNVGAAEYDSRLAEVAKHLQHMVFGNPADRPAPNADLMILARSDAQTWLRGIVEAYVENDWVEERAAEIATERVELAS